MKKVHKDSYLVPPVLTYLEDRQLAAILAGLRNLQECLQPMNGLSDGVLDIFTDGETIRPLTLEEIDDLCQTINTRTCVL